MRPLNQAERSGLIFKFITLFLVAVAIVSAVIYFNFGTYKKIGDQQVVKLNAYTNYVKNEKTILALMDTLNHQIETLGNTNILPKLRAQEIGEQIKFIDFVEKDTSSIKLLQSINKLYRYLLDTKYKAVDSDQKLSELKIELTKQKEFYDEKIELMIAEHEIELKKCAQKQE